MSIRVLAVGTLLTALPIATLAAGAGGFYLGVGVGNADIDDDSASFAVDDSDTALGFLLGYQLTDNVAVEGGYVDFGDLDAVQAGSPGEASLDGVVLGVRAQHEWADHFYLQARAGVFLWDVEATFPVSGVATRSTDDGEDLYYGIGARWDFAKDWGASLDYTRHETDDFDVDLIGATLFWRFDF